MAITLDHTIVPARDKEAAARWFAQIFGLKYAGPAGHFAPVRVNESLTLDFDEAEGFDVHHYAFRVGEEEFDAIFSRVREAGIPYGSAPFSRTDGRVSSSHGAGRRVYFDDPSGHILEIFTPR